MTTVTNASSNDPNVALTKYLFGLIFLQNRDLNTMPKVKKKNLSLKMAAYHEAGHAVIAHHFGASILEVIMMPTFEGIGTGRTEYKWNGKSTFSREDPHKLAEEITNFVMKRAFVGMAGIVAEIIYREKIGHPNAKIIGGNRDLEETQERVRNLGKVEVSFEELLSLRNGELAELLKSKWSEVEAVADTLIQKGTITGEEAVKVIEENESR